jgi:uncharacterized protein (TIGR02145 family)
MIGLMLIINTVFIFASAPVVENVKFEQRKDGTLLVDIYYDVTDADGDMLEINIEASSNNGITWALPCTHFTGDIGKGIVSGVNKHVVWDFFKDNPGVSGNNFRVRIIAYEILMDIDGKSYRMVTIGNQVWTAENLKVTRYRNGNPIPKVEDWSQWEGLKTGAYSAYGNDESNATTYGYLYNWYALNDNRIIAPKGWHVPTYEEWQTLVSFLGGSGVAGGKLKEAGLSHWRIPNTEATNESGFTGLPGGYRSVIGGSSNLWNIAYFWTVTGNYTDNAWGIILLYDESKVGQYSDYSKGDGFSVRLIKGPPPLISIQIISSDQIIEPGKSLQFICMAIYSDHSTIDKTAGSEWSISPPTAGNIDVNGLFTASSSYSGEVMIKVHYSGLTNVAYISVTERGILTDIDKNVYKTVKIGNQWWMAENLRVTHYRNGDPIPKVISKTEWSNLKIGAYCSNNNNESNAATYGYLYNWYAIAIDGQNIAPDGWHVPTNEEWQALIDYLGGEFIAGGKLKELNTVHWKSPNTGATNMSGFSAIPGGERDYAGNFETIGSKAYFWSSTEEDIKYAWPRYLFYDVSEVGSSLCEKRDGFSIRCVRDN